MIELKNRIELKEIEEKILDGGSIAYNEAIYLAQTEGPEELFQVANRIRERFCGNKIDLCTIMNAKSGGCSENCAFCSQSVHYKTGIEEYSLVNEDDVIKLAKENEQEGVNRFGLVTSGKAVSEKELDKIIGIIAVLKKETKLKICASLGCITYEQAKKLSNIGLSKYHHNLETSRQYFNNICTSHTYEERIDTIRNLQKNGIEVCSGGIIGLGESFEDRISMAFELKNLGIKSIPINILTPIKGTPLQNVEKLDAIEIFKTIAIIRLIIPDGLIRYCAGRIALGEQQRMGLKCGINAVMVGNYLTTTGNKIVDDIRMIQELGFEV